jgi:phosphatidate phosphatase APP1
MQNWHATIQQILDRADSLSDTVRARLKSMFGVSSPLHIVPYMGYGTRETFLLSGRVVVQKPFIPSEEADTIWENLLNTYNRFASDEVPGAHLRARFQERDHDTMTDGEGYFRFAFPPGIALDDRLWYEVALDLLTPQPQGGSPVSALGRVLVPPATASFGVISDIDDTVVWSNVASKLRMMWTVALHNARMRMPFPGVVGFYRALQQGSSGREQNPLFYVSSSPWNLYEPLLEFFQLHQMPLGPLFLRDFGDHLLFGAHHHHHHKLGQIASLLDLYPQLPFILIGDSGEQDPEIYCQIVRTFPTRIRVIYIRNVTPDPARLAAIDALVAEVRHTGCQLVLTPDSEGAATHAAAEGLIATDALAAVRMEKARDERAADL